MTNEEILRAFLKKKGLYQDFIGERSVFRIKNFVYLESTIENSIDIAFVWGLSRLGRERWKIAHEELRKMCKDLNITGEIDLMEV